MVDKKESLYNYVLRNFSVRKYPDEDEKMRLLALQNNDKAGKLLSWKDFAQIISEVIEEMNGYRDITVYENSTWAVCQEFLGNLNGKELAYTKMRSGDWNSERMTPITIRQVLTELQKVYP
jgi:hypothetical protein